MRILGGFILWGWDLLPQIRRPSSDPLSFSFQKSLKGQGEFLKETESTSGWSWPNTYMKSAGRNGNPFSNAFSENVKQLVAAWYSSIFLDAFMCH